MQPVVQRALSSFSSRNYMKMQDLLKSVNHHAIAVGMRINASKTKVSALIIGEQTPRDVNKFKYLGSMFITDVQGSEEIRSRINLVRSGFS